MSRPAGRSREEIVRSLLADSAADLAEVRRENEGASRQFDRGCFRAQQAAEKALRALRVARGHGDPVPSLPILDHVRALAAAGDGAIAEFEESARGLDRYFLRTGLPLGVPQIHGEKDLALAHEAARAIRAAATKRLADLGLPIDETPSP